MPRRITRRDLLSGADSIGTGDGLDPRFDRPENGGRPTGRKTLQLCGQVKQTLEGVLAEQHDEVLRDLMVASVTPAGGGRMLVRVTPAPSAAPHEAAVILARLAAAHGALRSEVASSIHRRKAPDLIFEVVAD
jgi:ribosome-binding factor A